MFARLAFSAIGISLFGVAITSGAANGDNERILYSFMGSGDGATPETELISDASGNFYGTTVSGGANGWGTVFRLTPRRHEKVLYSFKANPDGYLPNGYLSLDSQGNLYGTSNAGGAYSQGTVFKITPKGKETVLHDFFYNGGVDGSGPQAGLIQGSDGNLYGTTEAEGAATTAPYSKSRETVKRRSSTRSPVSRTAAFRRLGFFATRGEVSTEQPCSAD